MYVYTYYLLDIERYHNHHHHKLIFVSHETRKRGMWVACGVQRAVERRLVPVLGPRPALEDATHTHTRGRGRNQHRTNIPTNEYTNERTNKRKLYGSLKVLVPYICKVLRV